MILLDIIKNNCDKKGKRDKKKVLTFPVIIETIIAIKKGKRDQRKRLILLVIIKITIAIIKWKKR